MLTVLFVLWIAFNGRVTWEIVAIGVVLTAVLYAFCVKFLDYRLKHELRTLKLIPATAAYAAVLLYEIVKCSLLLIKLLLTPKYRFTPQLVTFETPLKSTFAQSVLANSITLTPGTLSVFCEGSKLTVHCLDVRFAKGIENLEFQQKLLRWEEA